MRQWARTTLYCLIQLTNNYDFHFFFCWKEGKTELALTGAVYMATLFSWNL